MQFFRPEVAKASASFKNQLDYLQSKGNNAHAISSDIDGLEKYEVMRRVERGETRILFMCPEQLKNETTRAFILS